MRWCVLVVGLMVACGGGSSGPELGDPDPRCTALCASTEPTCSAATAECEPVCQVRVAGMKPVCATCLLDHAATLCGGGATCCPDPDYPNSVVDCADSCADSDGVNPSGDHPICTDICASSEPSCSADVSACLAQCDARVHGVSGLCALCLLEGANGGTCAGGDVCCPHPQFPTSTETCASVCQ
jgi:hypothetical protein